MAPTAAGRENALSEEKRARRGLTGNALKLFAMAVMLIDHTAEGLLRIRVQAASGAWRSAMGCRTEASSDDLTVSPGDVTVNFAAQRAGRLTVSCCGRFA